MFVSTLLIFRCESTLLSYSFILVSSIQETWKQLDFFLVLQRREWAFSLLLIWRYPYLLTWSIVTITPQLTVKSHTFSTLKTDWLMPDISDGTILVWISNDINIPHYLDMSAFWGEATLFEHQDKWGWRFLSLHCGTVSWRGSGFIFLHCTIFFFFEQCSSFRDTPNGFSLTLDNWVCMSSPFYWKPLMEFHYNSISVSAMDSIWMQSGVSFFTGFHSQDYGNYQDQQMIECTYFFIHTVYWMIV